MTTGKTMHIDAAEPPDRVILVLKALGSKTRMAMLQTIADRVVPLNELALEMHLPPSTAAMHILTLEKAGLLHTELRPASRGLQKVCSRTYDELIIELPRGTPHERNVVEQSMPIGGYSESQVEPTCGLASASQLIGFLDDPDSFYEPGRLDAQLIWFGCGYLEYRFPNRLPPLADVTMVQVSAEVCSEAPLHDTNWPSDITMWINDIEIGTWTSPGDFGGERGRYTPAWWESKDTQFGVLKRWRITAEGSTVDGVEASGARVADLDLARAEPIRVRIGVKPDAGHVGGLNLFGRRFGNYQQDLVLRMEYEAGASARGVRRLPNESSSGARNHMPDDDAPPARAPTAEYDAAR